MTVQLYATFRLIANKKNIQLVLPENATITQAIDAICEQVPALKDHWLNENGELHAHVHGFLNGAEIPTLPEAWNTHLKTGDVLDFIPPVAGG